MLYYFLKVLTNIFYRVYYRIEFKNIDKVPYGKPVILAPNHTNAFVDPTAVAMSLPQKVRFFARGDVFKSPLAKWILNSMNISPMYRIQEGYSELKKNDKTFEECRNLLSNNKSILIFPEAICIQEKRLQPLKKGLSRIVFQTEELFEFKKNVFVVPVGLNYSNARKFRSRLLVHFGEPVSIKDYELQYKQDKVKTINDFTRMFEDRMRELIITISNKENDKLVEELTEIYLDDWMNAKGYNLTSVERKHQASMEIAEMVNYYDTENPTLIETLKKEVTGYSKQLRKLELRDHLLKPEVINKMNLARFFFDALILIFGMPVYVLGLITNYPPYLLSKNVADEKIKKPEFYASIYANLSMLLWVVYYIIQLVVMAFLSHSWSLVALYALAVPVLGYYTLHYYPRMKKIVGRLKLLRLVRKERKTVETLMMQRAQVMADIEFAKSGYINHLKQTA
ncbi:MAG: 1-acyl-sn-glycerol-3-phosphate acyltransferase [Bacteroidia bacterium]